MKTKSTILVIAGLLLGHLGLAQSWQLVWQDEFTNGISSDWVFEIGNGSSGWGNNELQYYRRENATVQNGQLVITAKRENYGGFNYTSARMKTQGRKSFRYGKIEARIAIPSSQGLWPAFWMLGFWLATQLFYVLIGSDEPVAWWAHLGGFAAGVVLAALLRRRGVALLGGR